MRQYSYKYNETVSGDTPDTEVFGMKGKLAASAAVKYISGLLIVALLLFVPAGTLRWFGAWLFVGVLFVPMLVMGAVLLAKNPELLEKRRS